MTATTTQLDGVAAATSRTNSGDIPILETVAFTAVCPKCKNVRAQRGYTPRSLFRLLGSNLAIEAYCVNCDEFWPISAQERLVLAKTVIEHRAEPAHAGVQAVEAQRLHHPGAADPHAVIASRLPPPPRAWPEVTGTAASQGNKPPEE